MPLSVTDVARIVALIEDGRRRYVSDTLGIFRTTVQDAWNRYMETGNFTRRVGSGRKRKTNAIDDRFIVLNTLRNRRITAFQNQHLLQAVRRTQVSERTIQRRLKENSLSARRPATGPQLLPRHRRARLQFARLHVNWDIELWTKSFFEAFVLKQRISNTEIMS